MGHEARNVQVYYTIVHINGEDNVWADLLSRWGSAGETMKDRSARSIVGNLSALFVAPLAPALDKDFTWPTASDIVKSQKVA